MHALNGKSMGKYRKFIEMRRQELLQDAGAYVNGPHPGTEASDV